MHSAQCIVYSFYDHCVCVGGGGYKNTYPSILCFNFYNMYLVARDINSNNFVNISNTSVNMHSWLLRLNSARGCSTRFSRIGP